jgi:parallel beta-helix repeat protein
MYKKMISFILISMFLLSMIFGSCTMPKVFAAPATLHVYQGQSIQAAINAANPEDIIQVASGTYNENIMVNKSISLIGENPLNTIIDGSGKERDVVLITANTNNVKIEGFTIQNGEGYQPTSLSIWRSRGHTIRNNVIKKSEYGINVMESNSSNIINNVIVNNTQAGIHISSSNQNNIIGNLLEKNSIGAWTTSPSPTINTFYHNNFINNLNQASDLARATKWDNGAEGNYWSNYAGQDLNGDGIGETDIPHLGVDRFPLIDKWSETRNFPTSWKEITYHTTVRSNSTVASFNFTYSLAQISFNVTGPQNTVSFCNVTVDKLFLDGNFTVLADSGSRSCMSTHNSTHTTLYFTFGHSTRKIQIRGTKVIGNTIPTANFTYSPTAPKENQDIEFNDTSTDPDGTVHAWLWNFGDGNTSSVQHPIHRYIIGGTYTVMLTVTDNQNATNTIAKTIVVALPPIDYTLYYILVGIVAGALIVGIAIFLSKKKKKSISSSNVTK